MITKKFLQHMTENIDKTLVSVNQRILVVENNVDGLKDDISFLEDISTEIKTGIKDMNNDKEENEH